ncbi:RICIN domain-containing protein [Streptomyces pseudovenezuelae]|uniref:RICIN domain-containing protein n=1 Tax=Streptomyces pseudovenezuelae TaxID=67350 RepID=UPI002E2FD6F2|nr:RICIN domain-containing protein [Streptomyces pseudovenezuelae]
MTALLGGDETMMSEHTPQQALDDPATGFQAQDIAAVHAYAGAFCGRPGPAADLAAAVLAGRPEPVARTDLLADVRRTAFGWLRDERAGLLRPGFRDWARRAGERFGTTDTLRLVEHDALLLRAFGELADQSRAALWLCLAEGEPAFAARVLSTSEDFAASLAESARSRLADTFLRLRAEHTADARCVHYGGMLGAIARGTHRETPADLEQHLETCEFCAHDIALLRTLTSGGAPELRPLLVDRILVWGGPDYRAARPGVRKARPAAAERASRSGPGRWAGVRLRGRGARASSVAPAGSGAGASRADRSAPDGPAALDSPVTAGFPGAPDPPAAPLPPGPRRPVLAIAVAVVVTAAATAVALSLLSGVGRSERSTGSYGPPPAGPQRSPSASAGAGTVLATVALKGAAEPGRCVGAAAGGSPDNIPAPAVCDGGAGQRWRVVDLGGGAVALQHVASTFCLDIAGYRAVGDPMQLRPCAYTQGTAAPYPEDQAFLLKVHQDRTFGLVCQDNPAITVGITNGEVRMLSSATAGSAVRFALDDALAAALGD